MSIRWLVLAAALLCACRARPELDFSGPVAQWPEWGGDAGGLHYSPLTQITPANVVELEVAWEHHSGDVSDGSGKWSKTSLQVTPIVVEDTLYYCTPFNRVFALDPETGAERWVFDPGIRNRRLAGPSTRVCRGVAYWAGSEPADVGACSHRIFTGTLDSELIALDAETGRPCEGFAAGGRVDLREGIGDAPAWEYYVTSPPLVLGDRVVVGALVADNVHTDAPGGVVRAFDARSGELRWAWDPVPRGWKPPPGPRYQRGTPNVWSILSGDAARGLVFVPTGNASPDAFGGLRGGLDYYASSTVALRAATGEVAWHFQYVHHDLWDYDTPSQPTLVQIDGVGGGAPALVQSTKMGHIFVLDRERGTPLYPVEERPVPAGGVPDEALSPTQPFPTHPPPLHPSRLRPEDAFGFTPIDRADCSRKLESLRNDGIFTPPARGGSILFPGSAGGMNWGGVAIDPRSGVLYANQLRAAQVISLVPREEYDALDLSGAGYPNEFYPQSGTPYGLSRAPLLSSFGAPCNPPPWGVLTAVDLGSGKVLWESTLGTTRDQAPWPLWFDYGAPNLGGPLLTRGGLVFIAATTDRFFRAFDAKTGAEIWRARIPFTGNSTPMTYRLRPDGRQYVVLAAGGHGWSESGDALLAFALP